MPKQPRRNLASSRAGRKPMRPTKRQRRQVEVAVSIGLTVDQIATAVEMSRRSVYSHFRDERATGRVKRLLANAMRLDKAADEGSVVAMKALHVMIERGQQQETDTSDPWADVAESISAQKPESRDLH